jgi:hypothetical protein
MAGNIKVRVNRKSLLKDVTRSNPRVLSNKIKNSIQKNIEREQKAMVREFESHGVTRELDSGPRASNISGLTGGYGNLFSFIGFESSDKPTEPIRKALNEKIQTQITRISSVGSFKVKLSIPSLEEIFKRTPIPWASGSSWAKGIESGISDLGSYLYTSSGVFGDSRSGSAIQTNTDSARVFKTTPYISKIIKNFQENLKNL